MRAFLTYGKIVADMDFIGKGIEIVNQVQNFTALTNTI